jgi:hypothetical protein
VRSTAAPYTESRLTRSVANERVGFPVVEQYVIKIVGWISEAALGWTGGAQRPVLSVNEPKKTGTRSARAGTRGQNRLVFVKGVICGGLYWD